MVQEHSAYVVRYDDIVTLQLYNKSKWLLKSFLGQDLGLLVSFLSSMGGIFTLFLVCLGTLLWVKSTNRDAGADFLS